MNGPISHGVEIKRKPRERYPRISGAISESVIGRKYANLMPDDQISHINGEAVYTPEFNNDKIAELLYYIDPEDLEITLTTKALRKRDVNKKHKVFNAIGIRAPDQPMSELRGAELIVALTQHPQPGYIGELDLDVSAYEMTLCSCFRCKYRRQLYHHVGLRDPCIVKKGHICQCENCFGHKIEDWLTPELFHNCPCKKCREQVLPDAIFCEKVRAKNPKKRYFQLLKRKKFFEQIGCKAHFSGDRVWVVVPYTQRQLYPEYFSEWAESVHITNLRVEFLKRQNNIDILTEEEFADWLHFLCDI